MTDRAARNEFALLLRRLASGRITNARFDGYRPDRAPDSGVQAVADAAWQLYDDFGVYRLRGRRALRRDALAAVARWVLFLQSDYEYEWPRNPRPSIGRFLLALMTFARISPIPPDRMRVWRQAGDYDCWPFVTRADYENALGHPRFFVGDAPAAA